MKTPEGKLKDVVKAFLKERKVQSLTTPMDDAVGFYWMPVPGGLGSPFLDFVICYRGIFVAIETKAPGKEPTPRQQLLIDMIEDAGGFPFWSNDAGWITDELTRFFNSIDLKHEHFSELIPHFQ